VARKRNTRPPVCEPIRETCSGVDARASSSRDSLAPGGETTTHPFRLLRNVSIFDERLLVIADDEGDERQ
jgi:hypothetical protein